MIAVRYTPERTHRTERARNDELAARRSGRGQAQVQWPVPPASVAVRPSAATGAVSV